VSWLLCASGCRSAKDLKGTNGLRAIHAELSKELGTADISLKFRTMFGERSSAQPKAAASPDSGTFFVKTEARGEVHCANLYRASGERVGSAPEAPK